MKSFEYTITDPVGLHARPAANLARCASSCASGVRIATSSGKDADAKSMLAIMTLGIRMGDTATFSIVGDSEDRDAEKLLKFCSTEL